MPLPLKATCYDPGLGGIPTTTNPRDLSGWAETYDDSLLNELGCETCRITGRVPSIEAAVDWTQRLMAAIEVYTPSGKPRFFGFLHDVSIPALDCAVSLTDMANVVIVRYTDPDGKKGTQTAANTGSIAQFGRKELVLNFSTAYAAEATNRAATVLAQLAYPPNKETITIDKVDGGDGVHIELTFRGWAETLKWLTTASTTTATAVTSTQVTSLIATYNSTNAFFDTAAAAVISTGFSATQYCDPDTTYYERIATLLAAGNSSQQRVAWGFYSRAITIGTAASAAPDTIGYYYSRRTRTLRDAFSNVIPPWDWAPDVMVQNTDALHAPAPSGAITTLTRKYVKRVSLSIDKQGKISGTLEPDDPDKLPEFLAKPVSVTSGVSARHAQIEARIARTAKIRTIAADNPTIYNPTDGVLNPAAGGTGVINTGTISTGGGDIVNTGGGNVDLGTGVGIGGGGSSAALGTGTSGRVAEWASTSTLQAATLIKSGAGVLSLSAASAFTLTIPATGTATLGSGTSGRVAEWSGTNTVQASTLVKSGAGVLTLSAGGTATLTIDSTTRLDGAGAASGDVLTYNGTAYAPATPAAAGAPTNATYITQTANGSLSNEQALASLSTGMVKVTTTTGVLSSVTGTSGRITEWSDGTTIGASTLIKSGAGVLTLSASGTATLTIDSSTRLDGAGASSGNVLTWDGTAYSPAAPTGHTGSGTNGYVAYWTGSSALSGESNLFWDASNNRLGINDSTPSYPLDVNGNIRTTGTITTAAGLTWDVGEYQAAGDDVSNGYVLVRIEGTLYRLMTRA